MIGNRMVDHNTKFVHRFADGSTREVKVKHDKKRGVIWVLDDGSIHTSPSGAAVAIRHRPTNGWDFWSVPSDLRAPRVRKGGSSPRVSPVKKFAVTRSCKVADHRISGDTDLDLLCPSCKVGLSLGGHEIVVGYRPEPKPRKAAKS